MLVIKNDSANFTMKFSSQLFSVMAMQKNTVMMSLFLWLSLVVVCDPIPTPAAGNHNTYVTPDTARAESLVKLVSNSTLFEVISQKNQQSTTSFHPFPGNVSGVGSSSPNTTFSIPQTLPTKLLQDNNATDSVNNGFIPNSKTSSSAEYLPLEKGEPSSLLEMDEESKKGLRKNLFLKLDRDYTPEEIAEYIFTTGDEKGISQAIGDMIQDGQLTASKDDMINFLEVVQQQLANLRNQFHQKVFTSIIHHDRRHRTSSNSSEPEFQKLVTDKSD